MAPPRPAPYTPARGTRASRRFSRRAGALAALLACACAALSACGGSGAKSPAHLSRADCEILAARVAGEVRTSPRLRSEPTAPLSHCQLTGAGFGVNVYLDAAHEARQRYQNRMTEQVQFGAPDPAKLPHPVPNVGDPGSFNHFASWVPAYDTLFAVRDKRFLTVAYSRDGVPGRQLMAEAAVLARLAFRLSSG